MQRGEPSLAHWEDQKYLLSRMALVAQVAAALTLLGAAAPAQEQRQRAFVPRALSPFDVKKAEWLLRVRLPCLGCHELNGEGGRIGPVLSAIARQRPPEYVYQMIRDPQRTVPGTIMPRVPMTNATLDLVASYLMQRPAGESGAASSPSVPGQPSSAPPPDTTSEPAALYGRACAPCHGARGGGDGYNARFLPVRPTVHRDAVYMSTRTDDELFDAVFAGGYVMNRSNRMPPFGQTLTRAQIWGLVRYLRTLCRCQGPPWSRDGQAPSIDR